MPSRRPSRRPEGAGRRDSSSTIFALGPRRFTELPIDPGEPAPAERTPPCDAPSRAWVIHTARGPLIDETALIAAIAPVTSARPHSTCSKQSRSRPKPPAGHSQRDSRLAHASNTADAVRRVNELAIKHVLAGSGAGVSRLALVTGVAGGIGLASVERLQPAAGGRRDRRRRPAGARATGMPRSFDLGASSTRPSASGRSLPR